VKGLRTPKEALKRDEKKSMKQNHRERKKKTFKVESLFHASRSEILM